MTDRQINATRCNILLTSCPWGPVTANGVDLLTKIYIIYMETDTSHRATARCFGIGLVPIMTIGPSAAAGEVATHRRKEIYKDIHVDRYMYRCNLWGVVIAECTYIQL